MNAKRKIVDKFLAELGKANKETSIPLSNITVDNSAFYDFCFYEYLFPTETGINNTNCGLVGLSEYGIGFLSSLESHNNNMIPDHYAIEFVTEALSVFETELVCHLKGELLTRSWFASPESEEEFIENCLAYFYYESILPIQDPTQYSSMQVKALIVIYRILESKSRLSVFFRNLFSNGYDFLREAEPERHPYWIDFNITWDRYFAGAEKFIVDVGVALLQFAGSTVKTKNFVSSENYNFEVFPANSVNIGIRLVYRQEWMPLGFQKGEIVKTIPLGPGETRKISSKIVRRAKRTSTQESLYSRESSEESTATDKSTTELTDSSEDTMTSDVKNSSEIVNEAKSSFNWKVETESSGGIRFVSGSLKAGVGGESSGSEAATRSGETASGTKAALQSKQTNSHLSEKWRKRLARFDKKRK